MITDLIEIEGIGFELLLSVKYLKESVSAGELVRADVANLHRQATLLSAKVLALKNKAFGQDVPAGERPGLRTPGDI